MGKKATEKSADINAKHVDIREVRVNYVSTKEKPFDIRHPENVASFFRSVAVDNSREQFMAMYLDASNCVISYSLIAIGSARQVSVAAPEIFQRALLVGAVALVVAHNHPSNRLEPSDQDIAVTTGLTKAGAIIGIKLLDHVIVGDGGFNSLRGTHSYAFG